jgi:hypothetical protein
MMMGIIHNNFFGHLERLGKILEYIDIILYKISYCLELFLLRHKCTICKNKQQVGNHHTDLRFNGMKWDDSDNLFCLLMDAPQL